jgi:hypothetical protein
MRTPAAPFTLTINSSSFGMSLYARLTQGGVHTATKCNISAKLGAERASAHGVVHVRVDSVERRVSHNNAMVITSAPLVRLDVRTRRMQAQRGAQGSLPLHC